jgi:hypothetical protein
MTNKSLIDQLKAEGKSIELNKERILSQIPRQEKHKSRLIPWHPKLAMTFGLLLLVVVGITLFRQRPTNPSIVTVDINPSIELTVNADNEITAYRALNLDGEVVIESMVLNNLNINDGIEAVIEQATALGYVTANSVININAFNEQSTVENRLNERIKEHFQSRIQMIEMTETLRSEAKTLNISPRKLALIQAIIAIDSSYTLETLIAYDIPKLNEIRRGFVANEIETLKATLTGMKTTLEAQKTALLSEVHTYISEMRSEMERLKALYLTNLLEFNLAYTTFSNTYFPNAQVPLLPSLKYQRLVLLESKLDAYETYLVQQVETLFEISVRGLYTHLVDTHANLNQLNQWQSPTHALNVLTSIELYLDASLYDQLFLASAKRLDVLLNQPSSGAGNAYKNILQEAYTEFMVYYNSNQVSESLKSSNYIQDILLKYQQKEQ